MTNSPSRLRRHTLQFDAVTGFVALDLIVVESVLVVPEARATVHIHRIDNLNEMLEELRCHVFEGFNHRLASNSACQLDGNGEHSQRVKAHPSSAIGLVHRSSFWQLSRPIEDANIV